MGIRETLFDHTMINVQTTLFIWKLCSYFSPQWLHIESRRAHEIRDTLVPLPTPLSPFWNSTPEKYTSYDTKSLYFRTLVTKEYKIQLDTSLKCEKLFPPATRLNKALKLKRKDNRKHFLFSSLGKCCSEADPCGEEGGCGKETLNA